MCVSQIKFKSFINIYSAKKNVFDHEKYVC